MTKTRERCRNNDRQDSGGREAGSENMSSVPSGSSQPHVLGAVRERNHNGRREAEKGQFQTFQLRNGDILGAP